MEDKIIEDKIENSNKPEDKIRVMIVDDSAVIRSLVSRMLGHNSKIEVAGTALNGRYALNKIDSVRPDVIVLDIEMPEMNGIEFLRECNKRNIKVPTLILSAVAQKGAKYTLQAMELGAAAFIVKPTQDGTNLETMETTIIETVLALGIPNSYAANHKDENHVQYDYSSQNVTEDSAISPAVSGFNRHSTFDVGKYIPQHNDVGTPTTVGKYPIEVVAIGISTGGPMALRQILPHFPEDFPVPIVIVQHMPAGFTQEFANSLDKICPLEVKEAATGDVVKPGRILIAPGHAHIKLVRRQLAVAVELVESGLVNGHMPSASVLFQSAAEVYGKNALACIMTGMGRDGADTIGDVMKAGGVTIAQDQHSSVVYGMPRIAIENGNIQLVRSLDKIVPTIIDVVNANCSTK
ncbi:MAG: chemotaxis response regulator protein-glutamate methylesterase [Spirochaetales bacterium]|nr:chemotaxis response regulator protein-glutamate methylesterase [Spirochaetales bacterium]